MALEDGGVRALEAQPLDPSQAGEVVVAPVPAQLAVDVRVLLAHGPRLAVLRGEHPHLVAGGAKVPHSGLPEHLVSALMVRRVHVADRQDPHRGQRMRVRSAIAPRAVTASSSASSVTLPARLSAIRAPPRGLASCRQST